MNNAAGGPREVSALYNRQRAIELAQRLPGLAPLRIFEILYPLWDVELEGVEEQGRPYELIEKFIERGIWQGELSTVADLASFFGLEPGLVEKVLLFLESIGHVSRESHAAVDTHAMPPINNSRLQLTPLGIRSVTEDTRYEARTTRRRLYFDAFLLHPLSLEHYEPQVWLLTPEEAARASKPPSHFKRLFSTRIWDQAAALQQLGQLNDRAKYNLPKEVQSLKLGNALRAYLPMYMIETRGQHAQPYYVIYTRVQHLRDDFFEQLVNHHLQKEVLTALFAEENEEVTD